MDFHGEDDDIIRSGRSQMFFKIGALKNIAIFTGKHLCRSPQVFSYEYCEILRTPFFTEHLQWLLFYYLIASLAPQ